MNFLGIFSLDESDFRYSIFVDKSRVQVLTLVVGCFASKPFLAQRFLHGNYDRNLTTLKFEHLTQTNKMFEDSSESEGESALVMDVEDNDPNANDQCHEELVVRHKPYRTRRHQKHHE